MRQSEEWLSKYQMVILNDGAPDRSRTCCPNNSKAKSLSINTIRLIPIQLAQLVDKRRQQKVYDWCSNV